MSTSGSFNPPSDPPCPEQIFTRAELIALRDAGSLRVNCHYRWQGPVIGVPGFTSPTVIEQHAVSANELSASAMVNTTFTDTIGDDTNVWRATVDIDFGTAGSILRMIDDYNNDVSDSDPDAPTVHTQFPWSHRGPNLRDNRIDDSTLTDWHTAVTAGVLIQDNEITNAGVHLTGMGAGSIFLRNDIRGPQVTVSSPTVAFSGNTIESVPVTFASTAAGAQSFQDNVLRGGVNAQVIIASTVASVVNFTGNQMGGFRLTVADKPTGAVSIRNNLCAGTNASGNPDVLISGDGVTSFSGNTVRGGAMVTLSAGSGGTKVITDSYFLDGYITEIAPTSTSAITLDGSTFTGHGTAAVDLFLDGSGTRSFNDSTNYAHPSQQQYTLVGAGIVGVSFGSVMNGARIVRDPATTANITLSQTRGSGSIIQGPGATGGNLVLSACELGVLGTVITQNGPGLISGNSCRLAANISNTATATRGLIMTSCDLLGGTLQQARTGGTDSDSVHSLTLRSSFSFVILTGAANPGGPQTPVNFVTVESGGQLTLTDPVGSVGSSPVCVQNTHISSNALISGTGTGLVTACRFSAKATVNLGAFSHNDCVAEGPVIKTPTANNSGSLANVAFDNWV